MRPYIYLIEVGFLADQWTIIESTSAGETCEVSAHRWYWQAFRAANKRAERLVQKQGDNLRLEMICYDKERKMVKHIRYSRDPRSVS